MLDKNYELAADYATGGAQCVRRRALGTLIARSHGKGRAARALHRARVAAGGACVAAHAGVAAVDDAARALPSPPARRIVSLAPHVTELLFAAGAGARVVGVVAGSDWPPEAARIAVRRRRVRLDLERIVALKPDLVVTWPYTAPAQVGGSAHRGIPVFTSNAGTIDGIAHDIERLGELAGTRDDRAARRRGVSRRLDAARRGAAAQRAAPLRVFYEIWDEPLYTIGGAHLISAGDRAVRRRKRVRGARASGAVGQRRSGARGAPAGDRRRHRRRACGRRGSTSGGAGANCRRCATANLLVVDANLLHRAGPRFARGVARSVRRVASVAARTASRSVSAARTSASLPAPSSVSARPNSADSGASAQELRRRAGLGATRADQRSRDRRSVRRDSGRAAPSPAPCRARARARSARRAPPPAGAMSRCDDGSSSSSSGVSCASSAASATRRRSPPDSVRTSRVASAATSNACERFARDAPVSVATPTRATRQCGWRPTSTRFEHRRGERVAVVLRQHRARRARSRGDSVASGAPSSVIVAGERRRKPASVCSSVVLPAPLRPTIAHTSPACDVESTARSQNARAAIAGVRPRAASSAALIAARAAATGTSARRSAR